jgi:hypothetical protein
MTTQAERDEMAAYIGELKKAHAHLKDFADLFRQKFPRATRWDYLIATEKGEPWGSRDWEL